MNTEITREEAAAALAKTDLLAANMRRDLTAMRVAMAAFGIGSAGAMLIMGLVGMGGQPGALVAGVVLLIAAMIPVQIVGVRAKARVSKFARRYLIAILVWGVVYAAGMIVGGFVFPLVPAFWIPAAVVSALPGLWFAATARDAR
ncbi:hypothetical protein [Leucobacter sp. gxy201]|uniref:hypothetical protein n=1 Tax=Leucobacter sp. gxy201 TaxID=2957200 RepID=UPI003DA11FCF